MRHAPSVCGTYPACAFVRACVFVEVCAWANAERVPILAQPWHAMRATADRACSGAARYPQPLYISGVNRFITVRRSASKANNRNDRRPAHKRATCRVSASEAGLQRQCGTWRHRACLDAGILLLDVHGERRLRSELEADVTKMMIVPQLEVASSMDWRPGTPQKRYSPSKKLLAAGAVSQRAHHGTATGLP
jgi:hypothetical protein